MNLLFITSNKTKPKICWGHPKQPFLLTLPMPLPGGRTVWRILVDLVDLVLNLMPWVMQELQIIQFIVMFWPTKLFVWSP